MATVVDTDRGTVERIVRLISFVASADGEVSIKTVSEELGLPQSTAHRLVRQLVSLGMMQRAGDSRRYEFGPGMYRLGAMITRRVDLVYLATSALDRIAEETREGCALGLLREQDCTLVFAAQVESPQPLRYRVPLYEPVSIVWGASGRSVLAFLAPELVVRLGKSVSQSPTGQPPLSMRELQREMETIRARGFAVNQRGEKMAGASGISAPIFGSGGRVLGCLTLTIPMQRYPRKQEAKFGRLLVSECERITAILTGQTPP